MRAVHEAPEIERDVDQHTGESVLHAYRSEGDCIFRSGLVGTLQRMETYLPLVTLFVGYFIRGEYAKLTERGRLPIRIERELAILSDLPEGPTRRELLTHLELQIRYLIAHEDYATTQERLTLRWGYVFMAMPFVVFAIGITEGFPSGFLVAGLVPTGVAFLYGLN